MASLPLVDVHTPTSSFSIVHSLRDDTLETLFSKLSKKLTVGHSVSIVGPGWLKYEWNQSFWTLDDDSDYAIFTWRMHPGAPPPSPTSAAPPASPTLFAQKPDQALPGASEYQNPSFYAFRPKQQHHHHPRSGSPNEPNGRPRSVRSAKSRKSMRASVDEQDDYKTKFNKFHTENGVRTVTGKIGPVEGVRMLLRKGHRHVYLSRSFAQQHGFVPKDTAPGHYGYTGLVQIGKWPITLGKTTTTHDVYLSEEAHFDVILGRSFMETRGIKLDALDSTSVMCMDTGEQIDCDIVVIKDWRGEVVTIT